MAPVLLWSLLALVVGLVLGAGIYALATGAKRADAASAAYGEAFAAGANAEANRRRLVAAARVRELTR